MNSWRSGGRLATVCSRYNTHHDHRIHHFNLSAGCVATFNTLSSFDKVLHGRGPNESIRVAVTHGLTWATTQQAVGKATVGRAVAVRPSWPLFVTIRGNPRWLTQPNTPAHADRTGSLVIPCPE